MHKIIKYLCYNLIIIQIREPRSKVPDIVNGDAVPLLNESNIYTINRLQTLWPGVSYVYYYKILLIINM